MIRAKTLLCNFFISFIIFAFFSCSTKNDKPITYVDPAFGEFITSYTAGVVGSNASIKIMFAKTALPANSALGEASGSFFDFSPSVDGKTVWLDNQTIEFRPSQRMKAGQIYEVAFQLSKLFPVKKELAEFNYSFQVIPQNYELTVNNIKPYVKTELKRQKIEGSLITADFAEPELVEKMLSSQQEGKSLKVSWQHDTEGKNHTFTVEDVVRKEEESTVTLSVNGNSIEVEKSLVEKVTVPSLDDFKLMNARVVQNPNQYVALQFSDPIKEGQQLNGLISIGDDRSLQLDFDIHDNEIWVYPPVRQAGTKTIYLEAGIKNIIDYKMKKPSTAEIVFEQLKPAVKFVGKGSILPSTDGLVVPFEAVNLKAVDVSINKIFENNILQFLQVNTIEGGRELHRVGRNVLKKTIQLDNSGITDLGKWNRFTLDLSKLIATEPGAIYQIGIKFKKSYSAYICEGQSETELTIAEQEEPEENSGYREYDYYEDDYYYYEGYEWEQRDNPCHISYYSSSERKIQKNILASDIGLIVKKGDDGTTTVVSTDLKTAKPLAGVTIELYDFQQQLTSTLTTNTDGLAALNSKNFPFAVIAKSGTQRGYMRLVDGESVSLSGFDVSGESISKGLKGFLYGERGVWRPGDSLFLSFILEDRNKTLPPTHPVVFELQNPQGVVTSRLVKSSSENGFYKFATATTSDAPTGNWNARLKVGGAEFSQQIKIETIKPNRLKINLDFGVDKITNNEAHGELSVKWLHGAVARNLKAEFEMIMLKGTTSFRSYENFTFEEINSSFNTIVKPIFQGNVDEEGKASINVALETAKYPGFMNVVFKGKVFEESGNYSVDRFSLPFYPYESYVGLRLPEGEKYSQMLYTDEEQTVDVVFLDANGKPVAREGAEINLYRLDRYWWWDSSSDNIANYLERNSSNLISSGKINAASGKSSWKFKVANADWGTYYIKICDPVSGHCTSKTFYIDQPGYYGRNSRAEKGGATRLSFSADKQSYNVGEKINLSIPGSGDSRAFISIENGSKVLSTQWVETKKGDNKVAIDVTPEMAPNVFVNITLLQPHAQTSNDLPIRLYGIIPLGIENPLTHLDPQIEMANELEPGQEVRIKVSEKSNRKMTFTLAMVDEGLLDITRFKTPEPWKRFYVREALGVKTWDLFDDVISAYGGRIDRLFAIGGDGDLKGKDDDPRANRFKPAVKFFGPYTVNGGNQEVKFTMPQYIGSVKVMVVAGYEGAYGNVDKVVPVRKPLMVLATLPRVLGPEEKVKLPITLFTQDKKIRNAKVEIKLTGPLALEGEASRTIQIPSSGDITVDFDLAVKAEVGIAKVVVKATSGSYQSTDEIEIEVRNPNVTETQITESFLEAGKVWSSMVSPAGMLGTNTSVLEISTIPPINMGYRLRYLMDYPHGCVEQTTSAAFPQLYLDVVKELTEQEKTRTKFNVTKAIERLKMFLARDGGFGYWPGDNESNEWGTTYAGHFMLEASSKGYFVPDDMLKRWKKYQKNKSAEWRKITNKNYYYDNELIQSYRLYTLALAGTPELGAMNRLREEPSLSIQSKWMLAASYMTAGQPEAAKSLITNLTTSIKPYQEQSYTYGSDTRDQAIILETLILMKEKAKAFELVKILSSKLSNQQWMSTQTVAFTLKSIGQFVASEKRGELKYSYNLSGKEVNTVSQLPISQVSLDLKGLQKLPIKITNEGGGGLFVRIINTGIPAQGQEKAAENNLVLYTSFQDMKGNDLDVTKLVQGTEFKATVIVKNPGLRGDYDNMALTQVFPSGWEINNLRLTNDEGQTKVDRGDYQDIRDDRVYTYFRLTGSRTFTVLLTASYAGKFYLPGVSCSAMYDNSVSSKQAGKFVEVVKKEVVVN